MSGTTTNVRWPSAASSRTLCHVPVEVVRAPDPGPDRDAPGRRRPQVGDVEVGVEDLAERPRDRRRGHEQDVRRCARRPWPRAAPRWSDPEAVLLVDDDEAEIARTRPRPGSARGSRRRPAPGRTRWPRGPSPSRPALSEPVSRVTPIPTSSSSAPTVSRCWRASRSVGASRAPLEAGPGGGGQGVGRDRGLARPDVALEQAEHRRRAGEVVADRGDRRDLVHRQLDGRGRPGRRERVDERRPDRGVRAGVQGRPPAPHRGPAGAAAATIPSWSARSSSNASRRRAASRPSNESG